MIETILRGQIAFKLLNSTILKSMGLWEVDSDFERMIFYLETGIILDHHY